MMVQGASVLVDELNTHSKHTRIVFTRLVVAKQELLRPDNCIQRVQVFLANLIKLFFSKTTVALRIAATISFESHQPVANKNETRIAFVV